MDGLFINSVIYMCFGLFHIVIKAQFTSNPPSTASGCTESNFDINWAFDESTNAAATVIWQKDGSSILTWVVATNNYIYGTGYDANKINHANTNGKITLRSLNNTDSGTYTCRVTYAVTGTSVLSGNFILTVDTCIEVTTLLYSNSTLGDQNNSKINVEAVAGGVTGSVIFLLVVGVILYLFFRKENVNTKTKDAVPQDPAQRHFHKALDYCKKHYNIDPFDENVSLTIVEAVNELIERIEKRNFSMIQSAAVNLNLEYKAKDLSSEIPIIFWKCFKANMTFIGITVKSDDEKRAMSLLSGNEEVSIHVTEMFKHKCTSEELINFFITIHEVNTNLFWKLIGEIQPHDRVKIYAQILVLKENSKI